MAELLKELIDYYTKEEVQEKTICALLHKLSEILPSMTQNLQDFLNVKGDLNYLFYRNTATNLDVIFEDLDTSNCSSAMLTFYQCSSLLSVDDLDLSNITSAESMFNGCLALTNVGNLITPKCEVMKNMFYRCNNLQTIESLDCTAVTNFTDIFNDCTKLTNIHLMNIKTDLTIPSDLLTHDCLVNLINELVDVGEVRTLTIGTTNIAKLTAEEIAVATNKNWTLE